MNATGVKPCSKCEEVKPLVEYYRNGRYLRSECKTCNGVMNAPRFRSDSYKANRMDRYYWNREEHIARSQKNRIERKFPYLRSEEHKQRAMEEYELRLANPLRLDIKSIRDVTFDEGWLDGGWCSR